MVKRSCDSDAGLPDGGEPAAWPRQPPVDGRAWRDGGPPPMINLPLWSTLMLRFEAP